MHPLPSSSREHAGDLRAPLLPLHPQPAAGVAAVAALRALGVRSHAVAIHLTKGLPLGSGLGSSAASAAAAAKAVDALFGSRLGRNDLVLAGLESEKAVSGFRADNIAPAARRPGRLRPPPGPSFGSMRERCIFGSPVEKDPKWVTRLGTLLETDFLPKFTVQDPNMSLGTLIGLLLETVSGVLMEWLNFSQDLKLQ